MMRGRGLEQQRFVRTTAEIMRGFGVPEVWGLNYAALHSARLPADGRGARGILGEIVAEGVYWRGNRPVTLQEFRAVTGLPEAAARSAIERAAERLGMPVIPGELRSTRFLPPERR